MFFNAMEMKDLRHEMNDLDKMVTRKYCVKIFWKSLGESEESVIVKHC